VTDVIFSPLFSSSKHSPCRLAITSSTRLCTIGTNLFNAFCIVYYSSKTDLYTCSPSVLQQYYIPVQINTIIYYYILILVADGQWSQRLVLFAVPCCLLVPEALRDLPLLFLEDMKNWTTRSRFVLLHKLDSAM